MRIDRLGSLERPRRLPATLLGQYAGHVGDWFRLQHQVQLLVLLGMHDRAARSAIRRMTDAGLLEPERRDGQAGHRLTELARQRIADSGEQIFGRPTRGALQDGWLLVSVSVPERERERRHQLRSRLERLGLGGLGNGLWVGPAHRRPAVQAAVIAVAHPGEVDLFHAAYLGPDKALVARAWDLEGMQRQARAFLEQARPLLRRRRWDGEGAFVAYTLSLHRWRMLPVLDPGLPLDALPRPWATEQAAEVFLELRDRLEATAVDFVVALTSGGDPS